MTKKSGPDHVVVDGSNIATEGRSMPSLAQLQDAVTSFMDEHPEAAVTVVVDATFGHRIDKTEQQDYEDGIANNELVAPPAGAIGRGDAFVLGIADKAKAAVLSNDSFQEFHGEYEWLFDEGRLIGGKPVPHVGWVFVDRVPVRGPVSRKATAAAKKSSSRGGRKRAARTASKEASKPMPTPTAPPPGKASRGRRGRRAAAAPDEATEATEAPASPPSTGRAPTGGEAVNEMMPFLEFVERHPVGSSITAVVDAYSSHGAYVQVEDADVRAYVPLRLMADPAPRSAKQVMKTGEHVELVVVGFAPSRRSIDCAVPELAERAIAEGESATEVEELADTSPPAEKPATKRSARTASAAKKTAAKKSATKKSATKKTAAKKSATKKTATKKTATKKTAAKKSAAKKSATKKSAARKTAAKKSVTRKSATKKAAAKKTAATSTATRKRSTRKRTAKPATADGSSASGGGSGAPERGAS